MSSQDNSYSSTNEEIVSSRLAPTPIRTVADYEALPDGTILEVVESSDETVLPVGDVLTKSAGDLLFGADPLHPSSTFKAIVCSVVRLGGEQ